MIKYFCDVCGEEKDRMNSVGVPCHLYSMKNGSLMGGHVDYEHNPISGREDTIHMCNKCKNTAYIGLLKAVGLWDNE